MRRLALLFAVLLCAVTISAEKRYTSVSATTTSATVHVNTPDLIVINDGSDTVYVRAFEAGEEPAAATSSCSTCIEVKPGEDFKFPDVVAVSIIADSGTATVRLVYE